LGGEEYLHGAAVCQHPGCFLPALTGASCCWHHLKIPDRYLQEVNARLARERFLSGFNLGKIRFSKVDWSGYTMEDSIFSHSTWLHCRFHKTVFERCHFRNTVFVNCDFAGSDAHECVFAGSILEDVNLSESTFRYCHFEMVRGLQIRFDDGDFSYSNFHGAFLPRSIWDGARLFGADFSSAFLGESSFKRVKARELVLGATWCRGGDFRSADLENANGVGMVAEDADFRETNLHFARLNRAILTRAQFQGADCRKADFREAHFRKAQCRGADFTGARLERADFTDAHLKDIPVDPAEF